MSLTPDEVNAEIWKTLPGIKQVLDDPDEVTAVGDNARLLLRGDSCVLVADGPWSLPPRTVISGAEWTQPDGSRGTWSFDRRSEKYVELIGVSGG